MTKPHRGKCDKCTRQWPPRVTDGRFLRSPQGRQPVAGKHPEALASLWRPGSACLSLEGARGGLRKTGVQHWAPRAWLSSHTAGPRLLGGTWCPRGGLQGADSQQACRGGAPRCFGGEGAAPEALASRGPAADPRLQGLCFLTDPSTGLSQQGLGYGSPLLGASLFICSCPETAGFVTPPVPAGLVPRSCVNEAPGPCPEPVVLQVGPSWGRAQLWPASLSSAGRLAGVPFSGWTPRPPLPS